MDKIIDYLKELELSEIEARLYLRLLEIGPVSVRDLAGKIEIKRTTAYFYIDLLVEKGLVIKMVKGAQKQVAANPPDGLEYLVKKKIEAARVVEEKFPDILNIIGKEYSQRRTNDEAEIKYYKGKNGVKKIYEEALQSKELRSYANLAIMENIFPENLEIFANALKKNESINMFEIFEDSPQSRKATKIQSHNTRYFYKFLPQEVTLSAADTLIYDGKVSIIIAGRSVTGVVFTNVYYYNNSKELFDFIWRVLPKVKQ